jgi:hypothetical protein
VEQAAGPVRGYVYEAWTGCDGLGFARSDDAEAGKLAGVLAEILDEPGWYANFSSPGETFVIYPGRVFRYPRGDGAGRAEARAYGRTQGVPEPQLDWSE